MAYGFSPIIPLVKSEEDGFYALTKTLAENVKQNFKNLLLTSPGERVMIPDFGVGLRNELFRNRLETVEADITHRIEEQVDRFMPYVSIDDIVFNRSESSAAGTAVENLMDVQIYYSVDNFNYADMISITKVQYL